MAEAEAEYATEQGCFCTPVIGGFVLLRRRQQFANMGKHGVEDFLEAVHGTQSENIGIRKHNLHGEGVVNMKRCGRDEAR